MRMVQGNRNKLRGNEGCSLFILDTEFPHPVPNLFLQDDRQHHAGPRLVHIVCVCVYVCLCVYVQTILIYTNIRASLRRLLLQYCIWFSVF